MLLVTQVLLHSTGSGHACMLAAHRRKQAKCTFFTAFQEAHPVVCIVNAAGQAAKLACSGYTHHVAVLRVPQSGRQAVAARPLLHLASRIDSSNCERALRLVCRICTADA
eukprot:1157441-Pelagomonas_calceolata.AAC.2